MEPAPDVGEENPDHDIPDVGDNPEALDGGDNPPPHNIQNPEPHQQPEAVPPEIENPHPHPQPHPDIHHPEPAQGKEERGNPLERSGKRIKLSGLESQVATG